MQEQPLNKHNDIILGFKFTEKKMGPQLENSDWQIFFHDKPN